jgi:hypothetical protein
VKNCWIFNNSGTLWATKTTIVLPLKNDDSAAVAAAAEAGTTVERRANMPGLFAS